MEHPGFTNRSNTDRWSKDLSKIQCFKCQDFVHYSKYCPTNQNVSGGIASSHNRSNMSGYNYSEN